MSSAYLLGSHEIWLAEALEMVVTARWPEEGAAATASSNEDEELRQYRAEKAKFDQYQEWERQKRNAESSPLGSLYSDHSIGSLNEIGASWLAPAPFKDPMEAPRATELIVSAFEKEIARNGLCDKAWTLLRQALRDDVLPAFCFLEVQPDEQFPAEAWGKPPNQKSHLTGKGYLRRSESGGGLLGGRVYLRRADVISFLDTGCLDSPASAALPSSEASDSSADTVPDQVANAISWLEEQVAMWTADRGSKKGKGTAWVEVQLFERFGLSSTIARALYQDDKIVPKSLRPSGRPKKSEKLAG